MNDKCPQLCTWPATGQGSHCRARSAKTACERAPRTGADLASQPTLSRWENQVSRTDLYRLAGALLDTFLASYPKPPQKIILDIDDTEDITHGAQQLTLFNAYHKDYCYMPLHLYEGHSGRLITAILRRGRRIKGAEAATILRRVFAAILKAWPKVRITLRGDAHFSTPQVHEVCEEYRVSFILGQAANAKLNELGAPLMDQALAQAEAQAQEGAEEKPVRLFPALTTRPTAGSIRNASSTRPRLPRVRPIRAL